MHACDGQTDGRTDRQTDRILLAIPVMQHGKNTAYRVSGSDYFKEKCHVTKSDLRDFIQSTVVQHFVYHNTSDTKA